MRAGAHGAQLMATNAAFMRELADFQAAHGPRRDTAKLGPSRRRESGGEPTDRGMWWQEDVKDKKGTGEFKDQSHPKGKHQKGAPGLGSFRCIRFERWDLLVNGKWLGMAACPRE